MENSLLSIFYFLLLATYLTFSSKSRIIGYNAFIPPLIFLIKCLSGFLLAYIYSEFYRDRNTADVFKLFDDAKVLFDVYKKSPEDFIQLLFGLDSSSPYYDAYTQKMANWSKGSSSGLGILNDNRTLIRINAVIMFVSYKAYAVHVLVFSFISTLGFIKIYRAFHPFFERRENWLFVAVFLIPSVLCWSSGVLKEALLFYLIGVLVSLFIHKKPFSNLKHYFILIVLVVCFIALKIYILLAFIPGILAWLLVRKFNRISISLTYLLVLGFMAITTWIVSAIVPSLDVVSHLSFMQQNMLRLAFYNDSGSIVEMQPLQPELWSYLRNLPEGLINAAFRPGFLDAQNSLQLLAAFENAFIIICMILSIGLFKRPENRIAEDTAWFCFSFVLVLYTIMGLSTPILGALIRYRMPALPFLFIGMLLITDTNRLLKIIFELFNYEPRNYINNRS